MTFERPLEMAAANPATRAILDKDLPGLTTHMMWGAFKPLSLKQPAVQSSGRITAPQLRQIAQALAALR